MARRLNRLATLLVLLVALCVAVYAQGPSDTNNNQPTTPPPNGNVPTTPPPNGNVPTTPPPNGVTPTTPPPNGVPSPTPTTKRPVNGGANNNVPDTGSSGDTTDSPTTTTPVPTKTTKAPVVGAANAAATAATPPPAITTTAPEILVDRAVKSEYGTRSPTPTESISTANTKSEAAKTGAWLVPAVIGAVIIAALIVMTFFVRSRRSGHADEDYNTPRRGSDNFLEHPKTTTSHHVAVPVLGDPVKDKVAADQSSMKTHAVGGAYHSPRANRVASSPPLMAESNRPTSPGFGTYKQKPMEGSSVVF